MVGCPDIAIFPARASERQQQKEWFFKTSRPHAREQPGHAAASVQAEQLRTMRRPLVSLLLLLQLVLGQEQGLQVELRSDGRSLRVGGVSLHSEQVDVV